MLSVVRLREFVSTLRFRLVLWITLVVFVMVVVTNIAVREIEQRTLRSGYDQFLKDSLEEVNVSVAEFEPENKDQLYAALKKKVKDNEYRSWFLQLYDEKKICSGAAATRRAWIPPRFCPTSTALMMRRNRKHTASTRKN